MKKFLIIVTFLLSIQTNSFSQEHSFEIKDGDFLLDQKPVHIYAGEMHYARIPEQYWQQRLQMLKAMGLNAVTTYVFWNYHHPSPNVWDFKTGNHNLKKFIQLAQQEGLYVILRPGPYVCAEWDFGGFPWWFSTVKGMQIRTDNQPFLDSCKIYFQKLHEQIKGLHITEGGNIILTQVENEFGSYVMQQKNISFEQHKKYAVAIKTLLEETGFKKPFYTADGNGKAYLDGGAIKDVFPGINGEDNVDSLKKYVKEYNNGTGPYFIAEFYPGWLDHWAEPFVKVGVKEIVEQTEKYLKNDVSFSFYMIHGGTNFGYTAGANYTAEHPVQPDITSYDYDAPISEAGWATDKYKALRELMKGYTGKILPEIPKAAPVIILSNIQFNKTINFFDWIKSERPVYSVQPKTFEELGIANGYVLYRKKIQQPITGKLKITGLRDFATVYINGNKIGELNRYYKKFELDVNIPANAVLDILVESMGRINYGAEIINNLKGIISPVFIEDKKLVDWQMLKAPLEQMPGLNNYKTAKVQPGNAVFYSASFTLNDTGDTFLDMKNFSKGIVFVNGHHLGRYWNAGPQQTLYLPGCWLKKGTNKIVIFDQVNETLNKQISSLPSPVMDKLK